MMSTTKMMTTTLLVLAAALPAATAGGGDGAHPWEWAGVFDLPTDQPSQWIFQKKAPKEGEAKVYADETMQVCYFGAAQNTKQGIELLEAQAEACYNGTNVEVANNGVLQMGKLMRITFDQNSYTTTLNVPAITDPAFRSQAAGSATAAFFFQHFPSEFEDRVHWLQTSAGEDIEAGATEPPPAEPAYPNDRATAYGACMIVIAVCFTGVLLSAKGIIKACGGSDRYRNSAGAFASGALIFCAFALLLPEGLHMLGSKDRMVDGKSTPYKESEVNAIYAFSFTIGVVFCILMDIFTHKMVTKDVHGNDKTAAVVAGGDAGGDAEAGKAKEGSAFETDLPKPKHFCDCSYIQPIAYQIIVGDFFHNLVDGIVVGAAFMQCDATKSAGWTVTAGTIYHEITQEVSDFLVLISEGRMTFAQAALGNFVSALGVLLGCIIVTESNPDKPTQGGLMAFGASFYVYVGLSQLRWWTVESYQLRNFIFFALGCTGIGLVLISHEHCTPVGAAGHAH